MCEEDFSEFFQAETGPLVTFVRRTGVGLEQARDAAQEAMTRAFLEWAELRQPRAWVRTTAIRIAIAEDLRARDGIVRAVVGGWTVSTHVDPDVAVLSYEHEQLLKDLNTLPLRQRLVMTWKLDGFENDEIAEQLDMTPATVRSNYRHARATLRSAYLARGGQQ
ncbi:sigma-70 family RNA polymerase sigma factor [Kibdelosporangium lantanae]